MDTVKVQFKRAAKWKYIEPIVPASEALPDWYKNSKLTWGHGKPYEDAEGGKSFKGCPAILDTLTQGYIVPLWADIYVEPSGEFMNGVSVPKFTWNPAYPGESLMTGFPVGMTKGMPSVEKSNLPIFKVNSPWFLKTPKGYSTLQLPLLNNEDSRFEVVPGIICSDEYPMYINIPFVWTAPPDYEGVLLKGTPFTQIIPFKREVFQQELGFITPEEEAEYEAKNNVSSSSFKSGYKRFFRKISMSK
jgi:hypothetical protein